ncbi:MAG: hypothetical protein SVU88_00340 [Candidatus Nanohaloarchaea archaeon]|nr:hypothetical protein [Candidatus Nanohaloarchaea archaeon]
MPQPTVAAIYQELKELRDEIAELKYRVNEDYELSEWAKKRIEWYEDGREETVAHDEVTEKFT